MAGDRSGGSAGGEGLVDGQFDGNRRSARTRIRSTPAPGGAEKIPAPLSISNDSFGPNQLLSGTHTG